MRIVGGRALQALRKINNDNMPHLADLMSVQRVRVPDSGGQYTENWVTEEAAVPCRMNPGSSGGENIVDDQPSVAAAWTLVFAWNRRVREGMRALVSGTDDGVTWSRLVELRRVLTPRGALAMALVLADDVQP